MSFKKNKTPMEEVENDLTLSFMDEYSNFIYWFSLNYFFLDLT